MVKLKVKFKVSNNLNKDYTINIIIHKEVGIIHKEVVVMIHKVEVVIIHKEDNNMDKEVENTTEVIILVKVFTNK